MESGAQYSTLYKLRNAPYYRILNWNVKLANPSASTAEVVSPTIVDLLQEEQCPNWWVW